jgi:hypothetical protein
MPAVGLEPTISVLEWGKTVHALGRAATVLGILYLARRENTQIAGGGGGMDTCPSVKKWFVACDL